MKSCCWLMTAELSCYTVIIDIYMIGNSQIAMPNQTSPRTEGLIPLLDVMYGNMPITLNTKTEDLIIFPLRGLL